MSDRDQNKELAIFNVVDYVLSYAGISGTTDWLTVKKEIVFSLNNDLKKMFSRRHYSTKKHTLNDLEKCIIAYWQEKTGAELVLDPAKTHDPLWTNHGGRGWALNNGKIRAGKPHNSSGVKHD